MITMMCNTGNRGIAQKKKCFQGRLQKIIIPPLVCEKWVEAFIFTGGLGGGETKSNQRDTTERMVFSRARDLGNSKLVDVNRKKGPEMKQVGFGCQARQVSMTAFGGLKTPGEHKNSWNVCHCEAVLKIVC
jgi:hypothetical protein